MIEKWLNFKNNKFGAKERRKYVRIKKNIEITGVEFDVKMRNNMAILCIYKVLHNDVSNVYNIM